MNGKAAEDYIADYVEGRCDDAIRDEIDRRRQQEPDFDRWVRTHEDLLSVLTTTPMAAAPNGLSDRILSTIRQKEERLAEERGRHRREMIMLMPIGVLVGTFLFVLHNILTNRAIGSAYAVVSWLDTTMGTLSLPTRVANWLNMVGAILNHQVQLPSLATSVPIYIVVAAAMLIGVIVRYRDDAIVS